MSEEQVALTVGFRVLDRGQGSDPVHQALPAATAGLLGMTRLIESLHACMQQVLEGGLQGLRVRVPRRPARSLSCGERGEWYA